MRNATPAYRATTGLDLLDVYCVQYARMVRCVHLIAAAVYARVVQWALDVDNAQKDTGQKGTPADHVTAEQELYQTIVMSTLVNVFVKLAGKESRVSSVLGVTTGRSVGPVSVTHLAPGAVKVDCVSATSGAGVLVRRM